MAESCGDRLMLGAVQVVCSRPPGHEGRHAGEAEDRVRDFGPTPAWHELRYVVDWEDAPDGPKAVAD